MGGLGHPGQPSSASSNPDTVANGDTEANPDANASTDPAADAVADATAHPATNAEAHTIAASNTIPTPCPVTLSLTDADACPPAGSHGPAGSASSAFGSRRRWRWRAAFYRSGACGISSGTRDRAEPTGRHDRGRFGRSG
jgi:hypothetical protein